ncbi:MAG TPA: sigma-70 family RNA polymerase sigma factor [Polyangia bacterium]|nr:sigma-70 family RNA polymerase sigma factor [Polyangia bacterium]
MTFKQIQTQARAAGTAQAAAWQPVVVRGGGGGRAQPRPVDVHSFQSIYDAYYGEVARWIRALGGPAADQDDLIQDVFVVVYRRLPDFDGRNLAGWLYRIAAHQVRDYRRLVWIKYIFRRSVALSSEVPSAKPTPVMTLETRERQRNLEHLLSKLSDPLRAAFVLFEIEGYTADEIAEMQSVPTNTVRARIHRARKKMTALLQSAAKVEGNA